MAPSQPGSATAAAAAAAARTPQLASGGGAGGGHYRDPEGSSGDQYAEPNGGSNHAGAAADGAGHGYAGAAAGGYGEWAGQGLEAVPATDDASATAASAAQDGAEAYNPADYLQQLEAHLAGLQQQRSGLQQQLAQAAADAYQAMSQRLGTASTGVPLPAEPAALVDELAVLQSVRQYLQYVQELQALIRHVEKTARTLQQQVQQDGGAAAPGSASGTAFLQALSEAVDSFSTAMGYAIAVKQLADQGKVPTERLQQYASGLLGRVDAVQQSLRSLLSEGIQQRLAAAHWPPPLSVSAEGAAAAPAADDGRAWRGFAAGAGGQAAVAELQQLLVMLLTLQRASQHEQFSLLTEAGQEGPLLWPAEELAAPLAQRLRHHFASGLPTDRPDRPEWLFATALKAAQQCSPLAQELQPCVEAHGLQAWYSLPLEVARAVEVVGVNAVLGEHLLPQLVEAGDPALWLHLADEAMQFERRFAPVRGASLALPVDEEFLSAAHPGSTIELLFQRGEWREGWLGAELWDASRQLDAACDAYSAWQPAAQQLLAVTGQEEDLVPDTPRSRGGAAASRREFWPPVCAEQVASLVGGLVRRGGWVHGLDHKLRFMQAVPLAVLRAFRDRLSGLLQQAEQGMLGDTWLPRVGAAVNAAHYIEHHLREPQGVLLLAELQDSAAAAAAAAGATGAEDPAGDGGKAEGGAGGGARSLTTLVEREAAAFATLRKQWAYKLAKQAVDSWNKLLVPYKKDAAAFTAGFEEGVPPEQAAAAVAAVGPAAPSPAMLVAADSLQQLLRALAEQLDAVVFRDVWRSVALAVNYGLYNEVATEALFSAQASAACAGLGGAAQLDADLAAMAAIFGAYTGRPAAHFKESKEAVRLLTMPHGAAVQLLSALEAQPRGAKQLLAPHGVKQLNAEQAAVVLLQRLDVLTSRTGGSAVAAAGGGAGGGV
ncbi:hypothetical protein CHLNCDRAFT_140664 [Chlorella variabilis]|uniref:Uncharacterized protein n=1 Tax=Chlorella variabilis TaxID=554065 RepID=E1Z5X3_CHLVA|nr:hypothetical protein CHLNCDRAFT_140664 [Chlorella variabilis]EFN58829.1 hypothetical protein CHLNCDRAFT_140664 [Chlorella variabilis]|eukprot:XP_005850931.1 hypothetical protein CHLNCDRAFT_140664 [Chlorella variabilis]